MWKINLKSNEIIQSTTNFIKFFFLLNIFCVHQFDFYIVPSNSNIKKKFINFISSTACTPPVKFKYDDDDLTMNYWLNSIHWKVPSKFECELCDQLIFLI